MQQKKLSLAEYIEIGVPLNVAIVLSQAGELQPIGTFSSDEEERDKMFNNAVWGRKLGEEIGNKLAYIQLSLLHFAKGGTLIELLLGAMKECGFHKNYKFEQYL